MAPTIGTHGGTLLVRKIPDANPMRVYVGDVVVLKDPINSDKYLVRRLAAVEGYEMASTDENDEPFVLEKDQCWVLADNENLKPKEAYDSRTFGPVTMSDIVGRVIYCLRNAVDHGPKRRIWSVRVHLYLSPAHIAAANKTAITEVKTPLIPGVFTRTENPTVYSGSGPPLKGLFCCFEACRAPFISSRKAFQVSEGAFGLISFLFLPSAIVWFRTVADNIALTLVLSDDDILVGICFGVILPSRLHKANENGNGNGYGTPDGRCLPCSGVSGRAVGVTPNSFRGSFLMLLSSEMSSGNASSSNYRIRFLKAKLKHGVLPQ
ncbi:UNVERIFIED_CONTAM: hypothetical protein Scaly_0448100 [Sesamum calycinum]|uniref:Uncharacterized protein n=1 Tax=Sesamum calycinum TaxID=2727403 RepID=A0AAW2SEL7_9LAMI